MVIKSEYFEADLTDNFVNSKDLIFKHINQIALFGLLI